MVIRHAVLTVIVFMSLAASSIAANITFDYRSEPTPGLPNHDTWTVRAVSDQPMQGFDFVGDRGNRGPRARGFFGPMNQIGPFGGFDGFTIFTDNNSILSIAFGSAKKDSQFLVRSADVLVPAGFAEESNFHLQGIWAHAAPVGMSFDIAQLVIPHGGHVFFRGVIATSEGNSIVENHVSGISDAGLPPSIVDGALNARINVPLTHTFTANDPDTPSDFLEWTNFEFSGPSVAIAPTFNPQTQKIVWNPAGSVPGVYTASVTVTDLLGNSDIGTLTIHLVPEPATASLVAVAMLGLVGFARRRNERNSAAREATGNLNSDKNGA